MTAASPPPETHPTLNNQQLTQSLVSQLLINTTADTGDSLTLGYKSTSQTAFCCRITTSISAAYPEPSSWHGHCSVILQSVQTTSQAAQAGNFAVPNSGKQHFQIPQAVTNPTIPARGQSNGSSQSASSHNNTTEIL